jgi:hypothetical protein
VVTRAARLLRNFVAQQAELQERLVLINRPWARELLHWGPDGRLHGEYESPDGRARSTTRSGWCACPTV